MDTFALKDMLRVKGSMKTVIQNLPTKRASIVVLCLLLAFLVSTAMVVPAFVERAHGDPPGSGDPPVPTDVHTALLSDWGITTTAPIPGTVPGVTAAAANTTAQTEYGFMGGAITSTHLVLFTDPDLGDAVSEEAAAEEDATFTPVYTNHLAWLVVIRDASWESRVPGQQSQTFAQTVAAFIDATNGSDLGAVTLPPS